MMKTSSTLKKFPLLMMFSLIMGGLGLAHGASAATPSTVSESVDICPGINEAKVNQVDVLILLDNSKSLIDSDKDRKRFDALENLFQSISNGVENEGKKVEVKVSLIAFAQTTNFKSIDGSGLVFKDKVLDDPSALATVVRKTLTDETQAAGTNFINALDKAEEFLSSSERQANCKFLIWFTDGVFDYDKNALKETETKQGKINDLEKKRCEPNSWWRTLRDAGVNTYVVLLGELSELRTKDSFQESLDLMAQVTGDRTTEELGEVNACPGEPPSVVGEIFTVGTSTKEIGKLTPIFERIGVAIIGPGGPIYCPTPSNPSLVTPPLPDSKFLKSISLISLDLNPLPQISDIQVLASDGEVVQITEHFKVGASTSGSPSATKVDFISLGAGLEKGWKINLLANLKGYCLMATFIDPPTVHIAKKGNNPAEVRQDGVLFSPEELAQISFTYRGGQEDEAQTVTPDEIMSQKITAEYKNLISAELDIEADPANPLFGSKFSINVEIDNPMPDFGECISPWVFESDRNPKTGDTPSNRSFKTPECRVSTLGLGEGNELGISIAPLVSELKNSEGCEVIEPSLLIDGENVGTTYILPIEREAKVGLIFEVGSKSTDCALTAFRGMEFTYGDLPPELALITSAFSFEEPPNPLWVRIVTACSVLVAMLLSLLLLRFISGALAVMPKRDSIYSYEKKIEIGQNSFGQVRITIDGVEVSNYQPSVEDLVKPLASSSKSQLVLKNTKIERKLGGFFKPFSEPRALLPKSSVASYWQQSSEGGLAVPFKRAIVVSVLDSGTSSEELISGQLTILVPVNGSDGGIRGVESLLHGPKIKDVCKDIKDKVRNSSIETLKKSDGSGGVEAVVRPPGGPKPLGPPPIPS